MFVAIFCAITGIVFQLPLQWWLVGMVMMILDYKMEGLDG